MVIGPFVRCSLRFDCPEVTLYYRHVVSESSSSLSIHERGRNIGIQQFRQQLNDIQTRILERFPSWFFSRKRQSKTKAINNNLRALFVCVTSQRVQTSLCVCSRTLETRARRICSDSNWTNTEALPHIDMLGLWLMKTIARADAAATDPRDHYLTKSSVYLLSLGFVFSSSPKTKTKLLKDDLGTSSFAFVFP